MSLSGRVERLEALVALARSLAASALGAAAPSPLTLVATCIGNEAATTSTTFADLADFAPMPFAKPAGARLFVAAYVNVAASGQVDVIDVTAGASVLAAPFTVDNNAPALVQSALLVRPIVVGHAYELVGLAPGGEGGQSCRVQSLWVL